MKVKRGSESWAYIYVFLGFALSIEGIIVSMATPIRFPWKELLFVAMAAVTIRLFLFNGWFQNKLIGLKGRYEDAER
ncbi:MAG TPA: hypothetical protein VHV26_13740 [Rhizomicrobium sp.]|nr:hypothetical protein [Rhizomicrobium sp.]